MTGLRVGAARAEITPSRSLPLAGFAHRSGPSEGVARKLFARTLLFETDPGHQTLLVSADLIWWGPELVKRLRRNLLERFGLPGASVILHATHTHSGPQTTGRFSPLLGVADPGYLDGVVEIVLGTVARAAESMGAVTVERGSGLCSVGVNRRRLEGGRIVMAPNPDGQVDPEVSVVRFKSAAERTRAMLVHYACHPTTTDDNLVSSEFTGATSELLEGHFGEETVVLYLQGCCGDVRPSLVRNGGFYRGDAEDVDRLGGMLAERVVTVLEGPMATIPGARLAARSTRISLPLQEPLGKDGPEPESPGPTTDLEVAWMRLADGLSILALNAEPVVEYGLWTKRRFEGRVLPIGYSNGMIGYLPTASQVDEGGYEARDSAAYFGLPAPFGRSLEVEVKREIENVSKED